MHFLETEVDAKPLNIRIYSLHNYDLPNSRHQDVIIENSSTFHNLLPIQKYKVYQCIIFNSETKIIKEHKLLTNVPHLYTNLKPNSIQSKNIGVVLSVACGSFG
uniref:Uncharacterized protein n=1 Tax=Cucumis melo TaxID=3656 RepID=A0A9I9EAL8_CUCME